MINFLQTDKQKLLFNSIADFARRELGKNVVEFDESQIFPSEDWKKCATQKIHGLCIPKEYGGEGLSAVSTAIALEALGYGCADGGLNFAIAAQLLSCSIPIATYGSEDHKKKYLPRLCDGTLLAANAMTELESGSDAFSLKTCAVMSNNSYSINGLKAFVSNGSVADITLLYALTNKQKGFYGGVSAFIIDNKSEGISKSTPFNTMGLRTCMMCEIKFDDVIINQDNLLNKEGSGAIIFSESMNWERALLAAIHVGTMQRVIEICIDFINKQKKNGLDNSQSCSFLLADMSLKVEAARLLVYKAAQEIDVKSKKVVLSASMAKVFTSQALIEICASAFEIVCKDGNLGHEEIERHIRNAAAAKIYSGTNDIQKNIIASSLGL